MSVDNTITNNCLTQLCKNSLSLISNIPALLFSKDVKTGKYIACNQLFAEYVHKSSPDEVIGLTDYDIFDKDTAKHFVMDDQLTISMDGPYIFYEDVRDAAGNIKHFQTTRQKYTDADGRLCTLGMSMDVTEIVEMKKETLEIKETYEKAFRSSDTYNSIAKALSSDYNYLFCVDLDTEEFIEYSSDPSRGLLAVEQRGGDFFETSHHDAKFLLYEEDQDRFIKTFTKENIIHRLETDKKYSIQYRMMIDGKPVHMRMKAKWLDGKEHQIIIGVMNNELEVKQQHEAELIQEERTAYRRLNALSGDYLVLYIVDPETNSFDVYSTSTAYDNMGLIRITDDFYKQVLKDAPVIIDPEDLDRFLAQFTKENALKEIHDNGVYSIQFRMLIDGKSIWVNLKAAQIVENDEIKIIIGITDIDTQIRREMEYEHTLERARNMAHRDPLTGVKNRLAYLEKEKELESEIRNGNPEPFALILFDVNNLKEINDQQGHQIGDTYLKQACQVICNVFKHSPVYRIGGDEFAVVSRGQDEEHAEKLLQRLENINQKNMGTDKPVVAAGLYRYGGEKSMAEIFKGADERMYIEKERLKNLSPIQSEQE